MRVDLAVRSGTTNSLEREAQVALSLAQRRWSASGSYRPSVVDRFRLRSRRDMLDHLRGVIEPDGARLLDFGGGTGATTVVFGRGARELVVLEPNERKVARGQAVGAPVAFVAAVAEAIPYAEARFDRVVSLMSFHHLPQGDLALREVVRVLAPGGRFVLCDFDPSTPRGRWVSFFERRLHRDFPQFATTADLERRVLAAGFRAVRRAPFGSLTVVVAER